MRDGLGPFCPRKGREKRRDRELSFVRFQRKARSRPRSWLNPTPCLPILAGFFFFFFLRCPFPCVWDAGMRLSPARFLCVSLLHDENTSLYAINHHLTRARLVWGSSFVRVTQRSFHRVLDAGSNTWCACRGSPPQRPLLVKWG